MKKIGTTVLGILLLGMWVMTGAINPAQAGTEMTVAVNGKQLELEQPPVIQQGRMLLPMRAIFEALGVEVEWLPEERCVAAFWGQDSLKLAIGSYQLQTGGGKMIPLEVPAQILNGRAMVPVRAVSEVMGAEVAWDADTQSVNIVWDAFMQPLMYENERYGYQIALLRGSYIVQEADNQDGCTMHNEEMGIEEEVYASYYPMVMNYTLEQMAAYHRQQWKITEEAMVYSWCGMTNFGMLWQEPTTAHFLQGMVIEGVEYIVHYSWQGDSQRYYDVVFANAQTLTLQESASR